MPGATSSLRGRRGRGTGDSAVEERLHTLPARDDLVAHLEEQFDREVLEEASVRIRLRVEPSSWEAFQLTAVARADRRRGGGSARQGGGGGGQGARRVQKMLAGEVRKLEGDGT